MVKVLYIDVDYRLTGTSSLGKDDNAIKEMFGFKPLHIKTGDNFARLMEKIGTMKEIETELGFNSIYVLNEPYNEADFIVLDSISGLQTFIKKEIRGSRKMFTQQDWGMLADRMQDYLIKFACCEKNIIITCHTKFDKDSELGRRIEIPALSGQTGETIGQYLDIILYSTIETHPQTKRRSYKWQVIPDERRNARGLPYMTQEAMKYGGLVDQDFRKLFELIRKDTNSPVKIGIFGQYGTGKTYSLRTLVNLEGSQE